MNGLVDKTEDSQPTGHWIEYPGPKKYLLRSAGQDVSVWGLDEDELTEERVEVHLGGRFRRLGLGFRILRVLIDLG